jgi:hypothetical protein
MMKLKQLLTKREHGYALLSTLICLMIGGLIVGALLSYTNTTLKAEASLDRSIKGLYDADAGIENVLWCLSHSISPNGTLPQTLNGNNVYMEVEEIGECTLYAGEWITLDTHSDWILIEGNVEYDEIEEAYKYTITVTWNAESGATIHLSEVGAKLPLDYTYKEGSASLFVDNLSDDDPDIESDYDGAQLVKWVLSPPRPSVTESDPIKTQEFYIEGDGELENHYSWLVAARDDIGYVSELTGTFYIIISTAICSEDEDVVAKIKTDVMSSGGNIYIISWEINPD